MINIYNNNLITMLLDINYNILNISEYKINKSNMVVVDYNEKQYDILQNDVIDSILYFGNIFQSNVYFKDKTV
tara:strand:+ start:986 stop:1204 length:219 start_codon:yes stop_codon:yes gene_type:complete